MNKITIACMTYGKLSGLIESALENIKDNEIKVLVVDTNMENLMFNINKTMLENDVDIFIAGSAYAEIIKSTINKPVIKIQLSAMDYIKAIIKAKKYGNRIGFVSFHEPSSIDVKEIENLMEVSIDKIIYEDVYDLDMKVKNCSIDVLIGASVSNDIANKYDIPNILIYKGKESVTNAIWEAKRLVMAATEDKRKSDIYESVLNFNPSGIIITDEFGKIIVFNPSAQGLFNITYDKAIGKNINSIINGFDISDLVAKKTYQSESYYESESKNILINGFSLEMNNNIVGILITAIALSDKKSETNIKKKVNIGFNAKNSFSDIIGDSQIILKSVTKAKKYARSNLSILINGETGSGKEMFAQSIHNYSYRYNKPFVGINCATLPENLLESELFGYAEGAFTGSKKGGKRGLFEIANGGTIFLDELAEIPLKLQSRLLRVIQEKEIIPIGSEEIIPVNVRIIAATNKDLSKMIPHDFREDLYYRLNVLQVDIPSLRDRGEDIIKLFKFFLRRAMEAKNSKISELEDEKFKILELYSWPGNIRQIRNTAERFNLEIDNPIKFKEKDINKLMVNVIGEESLCNDILLKHNIFSNDSKKIDSKLITERLVEDLLKIYPNQRDMVAKVLGIERTTLWRILKKVKEDK